MLKETNVFLGGKTFLLHASNIYPKRLKKKKKESIMTMKGQEPSLLNHSLC